MAVSLTIQLEPIANEDIQEITTNQNLAFLTRSSNAPRDQTQLRIHYNTSNEVISELLQIPVDINGGCSFNVTGIQRIVSGRERVRVDGGKLSFSSDAFQLNKKKKLPPLDSRKIFKGYYEDDIEVAIQKIQSSDALLREIEREFQILRQLNNHENFIRYYTYETEKVERAEFVYIATELCFGSVEDLYARCDVPNQHRDESLRRKIFRALKPRDILLQASRGLDHLHRNHFVHRNVKPSSFLIKEILQDKYVVKISDFRLSKPINLDNNYLSGTVASEGWVAPESRNKDQPVSPSLDVFILGCFFHYVLTAGDTLVPDPEHRPQHPFGNTPSNRLKNIVDPKFPVYMANWNPALRISDPKAITLLKKMITFEEKNRPTLSQIILDPYFQREKEFYPIDEAERAGLCVIFNQELFLNKKQNKLRDRPGSSFDCSALENTFKSLGFDVEIHHNLMAFELKSEISKLAAKKDYFSKYGCLVVCLLSHGEEGTVAGSDGLPVNINKLKYNFSFNKCPDLYGKPKIFIVQACQGIMKQSCFQIVPASSASIQGGILDSAAAVSYSSRSKLNKFLNENWVKLRHQPSVPNRAPPLMDFLTIKSTLPGFVSIRNTISGSCFIQSLCGKLSDEYIENKPEGQPRLDLEAVLKKVQSLMNVMLLNPDSRQTMQWEACLSKYIKFQKTTSDMATVVKYPKETSDPEEELRRTYFYVARNTEDSEESDLSVIDDVRQRTWSL